MPQVLSVSSLDASEVRELLDERRPHGLTYISRTPWQRLWLETVFELSGPPGVVASAVRAVEGLKSDMWADRQW